MSKVIEGIKLVGMGIWDMIKGFFTLIAEAIAYFIGRVVRAVRRSKLRRATAYVNRYGYELDLNSRVKLDGKAYYVFALTHCRDIENRRAVEVALIGVPQYKEIKRRLKAVS